MNAIPNQDICKTDTGIPLWTYPEIMTLLFPETHKLNIQTQPLMPTI